MKHLQSLCFSATACGFAFSLAAQSAPSDAQQVPAAARASIARDAFGVQTDVDGVLAFARDYKARFTSAGVEFTPALGEAAPRNLPLRLSFSEMRRGTELLHRAEATAPQQRDHSVVYPRGVAVETYDVSARGLKHSFVFEQPLGGDGDLVVRCAWDSELSPAPLADGGIEFTFGQIGGVRIGQVIGIDAAGKRATGSLRLDGNAIELVLSDAFVDAATYPLVLDPLIGTAFGIQTPGDCFESDVAVNHISGIFLVVFQTRASYTDTDVFAQRINPAGLLYGGLLNIESSNSTVIRRPRVACVAATQRFLVAWQSSPSPFGPYDIRCAAVDVFGSLVSGVVNVAATAANEFEVAVGGDATTSDDDAVVAWCTSAGVLGCQVTLQATGNPVVGAPVTLVAAPGARKPAFNDACTAGQRFLLVWEESTLPEVHARYLTRNLTLLGTGLLLSTPGAPNTNPSVDGDNGAFMVCWERAESSSSFQRDIVCTTVSGNSGGLAILVPQRGVAATTNNDEKAPDITLLDGRYALVYGEQNFPGDNVRAVLVNPDCTTCNTNHVLTGISGGTITHENAPRIAGRWAGSPAINEALITYSEAAQLPSTSSDIVGQLIEAQGAGLPIVNAGGACALGGTIGTTGGPFVVGNGSFAVNVTGADPTALLFLSTGFPSGGIVCGGCALTNPLSFVFKVNSGGSSSSPFPLPCEPAFAGTNFEWQWVSFNTAFNPCPNAQGLAASNRLRATLAN